MSSQIEKIFREVFDKDELVVNDDLSQETLTDWDSLAQIKLIIALEEEFGIKFAADDVIESSSVGAIKSILRSKGIEEDAYI